jgi:hypothetical protein
MSGSIDERRPPPAAAHAAPPLPEQTFFADPIVDRLMGVTMALAAEVYILRRRVQQLERLQQLSVPVATGADVRAADPAEAEQQDAAAFAARLLQPLIDEQQSRGSS